MKKFNTDYQANAHYFAHAEKDESGENYGRRMFFTRDIMYSYGYHYIICKKVRDKKGNVNFILFNENGNSNTTAKQKSIVKRALFQKVIEVYTDIENFKPLAELKQQERVLIELSDKLKRARVEYTINSYRREILQRRANCQFLIKEYKLKSKLTKSLKDLFLSDDAEFFELLDTQAGKRLARIKRESNAQDRQRAKEEAEAIRKEAENIEKWKSGELKKLYLNYTKDDFLRISEDLQTVETSQGISVPTAEAKRVLKLIDKKAIVGEKIDEKYIVTSLNGFLKVGCHSIKIEEINRIKELILKNL
jgi:hypothetical protein